MQSDVKEAVDSIARRLASLTAAMEGIEQMALRRTPVPANVPTPQPSMMSPIGHDASTVGAATQDRPAASEAALAAEMAAAAERLAAVEKAAADAQMALAQQLAAAEEATAAARARAAASDLKVVAAEAKVEVAEARATEAEAKATVAEAQAAAAVANAAAAEAEAGKTMAQPAPSVDSTLAGDGTVDELGLKAALNEERSRAAAQMKGVMSDVYFEVEARLQALAHGDEKEGSELVSVPHTLQVIKQVIKEATRRALATSEM